MQHQEKVLLSIAACGHVKHRLLRHRAPTPWRMVPIYVPSLASLSDVVHKRLQVEHAEQWRFDWQLAVRSACLECCSGA